MKKMTQEAFRPRNDARRRFGLASFVAGVGCLLVLLFVVVLPRIELSGPAVSGWKDGQDERAARGQALEETSGSHRRGSSPAPSATSEEIVASKLSQFARSRRGLMEEMARRARINGPEE